MIFLSHARINTAGAYLCTQGLYPFAIGLQPNQGRIPVYRLGGRREPPETAWQCARREVYEETGLRVRALPPPATYYADGDQADPGLQAILWDLSGETEAVPYLVVRYVRDGEQLLSLMYLAEAEQLPSPCTEVHGLLLLTRDEIHWLCAAPRTLEETIRRGGRARLDADFDRSLLLEPFIQLRLLDRLLEMENAPRGPG